MDFEELRQANVKRCEESFNPLKQLSPGAYGSEILGAAHVIGSDLLRLAGIAVAPEMIQRRSSAEAYLTGLDSLADHLACLILHADLLAARVGIDLAARVRQRFNNSSKAIGSKVYL